MHTGNFFFFFNLQELTTVKAWKWLNSLHISLVVVEKYCNKSEPQSQSQFSARAHAITLQFQTLASLMWEKEMYRCKHLTTSGPQPMGLLWKVSNLF